MDATRDQPKTAIRYLDPNAPRDANVQTLLGEYSGLLKMGEQPGDSKEEYKKRRAKVVAKHDVTIHDARNRQGDLDEWDFDRDGFTVGGTPEPSADFSDRYLTANEYIPRVVDAVQQQLGASRAFPIGFQVRTEETGRGTGQASYARFAHSDYGPEYEDQFRSVLEHRFGVPEDEAVASGLCCIGFWAPIDRPAYRDPLCLMKAAASQSEDLPDRSIRLVYSGLSIGRMNQDRPLEEHIPVPGGDAPTLAPIYSPEDEWFFIPDMTPDQALIFKQYDYRPDMASRVCFHNSFRDRFHDDWDDCPGRRSIEVRIIATF